MKSILLSIAIFLISTMGFSQMNYPIPMDNTSEWRIYESTWDGSGGGVYYHDFRVFVAGDTIIGEHSYSRLLSSGIHGFTFEGHSWAVPFQDEFYAIIRTDSVRTYAFMNGQDELLFDFSLQAGDTLPVTINNWSPTVIITSIDTVLVAGKYLKRFNIVDPVNMDLYMAWYIEGIGHMNGLIEPMNMMLDYGSIFDCYAENHLPAFPEETACILSVDVPEQPLSDGKILIYPNPSGGTFTVDFGFSDDIKEISIINLTGNLVFQKKIVHQKSVNISGLPYGTYILTIISNDGRSSNRKIISCP